MQVLTRVMAVKTEKASLQLPDCSLTMDQGPKLMGRMKPVWGVEIGGEKKRGEKKSVDEEKEPTGFAKHQSFLLSQDEKCARGVPTMTHQPYFPTEIRPESRGVILVALIFRLQTQLLPRTPPPSNS